ncbi:MAG: hypothetical protein JXQ75_12165 [Phycisphaerae bacterium]|nr:hypothetical protein [Phycisphaerae bacterium]
MAPVMWALLRLVVWADRLYAWQYSPRYAPPTPADYARAAVVFGMASLTPVLVGLAAAVAAFRRKYQPRWPILEAGVVACPYLALALTLWLGLLHKPNSPLRFVGVVAIWGSVFLGGAVVAASLNMGASLRQRTWGKCALSALAICAGVLYLLWLHAFIIYLDT